MPCCMKGMHTRGDQGVPTIILEAVASHDHWIWHAFFGIAGSNNDINMLNQSPLFVQQLRGKGPQVQYHVNGRQYNNGYYLVDGIYLEWAIFVKSIPQPQSEKHKLFAQCQEGARKDVECAFGILQSRFSILKWPARIYDQRDLQNVMLACIILHNMVIEDEIDKDLEDITLVWMRHWVLQLYKKLQYLKDLTRDAKEVIARNTIIHDCSTHMQLGWTYMAEVWE